MPRADATTARPATAPHPPFPPALSPNRIMALMAAAAALTALSYWLIDRPLAGYAHASLREHRQAFDALTHIVDPIPAFAGLTCAAYTLAALFGLHPGPRGRLCLQIALAFLVANALKDGLKGLTGRAWPETWTDNNLSYIKDGIYGFFPLRGFNGTRAFQAFPSGHLTAISATAVSLGLAFPHWRWLAPLPIALVAVGMIGSNYHWLSDQIAGAALGSAVALAAHRLARAVPCTLDGVAHNRDALDTTPPGADDGRTNT